MNLLLQANANTGMGPVWIIILVGLVIITILGSFRNKKESAAREQMVQSLKVGDEIVTYAGVYGKIVNITNTTDGKVVLISTGEGDKISYMQMHINAIASVDNKQLDTEEENLVYAHDNLASIDSEAPSTVLDELEKEKKAHQKERAKENKKNK